MNKYLVIFTYLSSSYDCPDYISDLLIVETENVEEAKNIAIKNYSVLYGREYDERDKQDTNIEVVPFKDLIHGWNR